MTRPLAAFLPALLLAPFPLHAFEDAVRREEKPAESARTPVLTKPPELVTFVEAIYPPAALAEGKTASVRLQVTIAADGSVAEAVVLEPQGNGFDEAAVAAVKQFRFSPAELDGAPAPVQIEYVYNFSLTAPQPEPGQPVPSPTAILKGRLVERGSRTRVGGATVRCGDTEGAAEAITDEQGRFELVVPAGTCAFRAVAAGYRAYRSEERLAPGETLESVYHLLPESAGYETIVRDRREKKEVVRRTLQREELQKTPGTFGDPIRVIQSLPGLARAPFFSGALIVRGSSPRQTLTFLDGVDVPLLFHLGGGPSVINAEFLERLDFYPGGFGARYGRAVGGIVDVETRKGASDTLHGSAKVDFLDAGAFVEAPVGKNASVAVAARRSYIDALLPLVLTDENVTIQPVYWDYQLRLDAGGKRGARTDGSTFSLMAFGSDDRLEVVTAADNVQRGIDVGVHTLFHRVRGDWTWRKGRLQSTLTPYVGYDLLSLGIGSVRFDADRYRAGLREDFRAELASWLTLRTGLDLVFDHLEGTAEVPVFSGTQYVGFPGAEPRVETQLLTRTFNNVDTAAYVEADLEAGRFTVTPGLRAGRVRVTHQTRNSLEPRLWVRFAATERTVIKGSLGLYTQLPEAGTFDDPPFGNPAISYERALQTSLGVEQQLTDVVSLDVTGYFNRRYDLVEPSDRILASEDGTLIPEVAANSGLGRTYGMEVQLRHAVTERFFGWVSYTLSRALERERNAPYGRSFFDQPHILTTVGSYQLGRGWEVGARFRLISGAPKTPLVHTFDQYDGDADVFFGRFGVNRSARQPAFHQLDVRIEKGWRFPGWTLAAYLDVQNVYNARNTEFSLNDYRYRQEIDLPGVPFLPVIGLRGSL